jgi:branched-subunit amino acid transport protein
VTAVTDYGPVVVWGILALVGVATFALRLSFVYLFGRLDGVPPRLRAGLRYVPPAVFAAIVLPRVVTVGPTATGTLLDARLLAAAAAVVVAWRTDDIAATIVGGMVALWLLRFLGL